MYLQCRRKGLIRFCDAMNAYVNDPLKSFARWVKYEYDGDLARCFNYDYDEKRRWLNDDKWMYPGTTTGRKSDFLCL